jgi:CheY-like chemotaxis protein
VARILIVDDSDAVLQVARELLEGDGHRVAVAHDWRECRNSLAVEPDLVLVDIELPGNDEGDRLAAELREHPMTRRSRIVLFSGRSEIELQRLVRDRGADGFIWKGIDPDGFRARVARHLPG